MSIQKHEITIRTGHGARLGRILALALLALGLAGCASSPGGPPSAGANSKVAGPAQPAAQATAAATAKAASLVLDTSIRSGKLENGFSYLLRSNSRPAGRVFLRLVVKAGSLEEREDELGMAHFVEHMAFKGTKSFPKDSLVSYMQSIGMSFGAEVNAETGYASTIYELELPSSDRKALETGFRILRDWADGVLFKPEDVESERGVILAEERLGRGAGERVWKLHEPVVYGDSRISRRDPIGSVDCVKSMSAASLKAFYSTWYRPELMAVVATGDLPAADLETLVRQNFAGLADGKAAGPRPGLAAPGVPVRKGLAASIAVDSELSVSTVELGARVPAIRNRSEADFIANARMGIAADLIHDRLAEVVRRDGGRTVSAAGVNASELCEGYAIFESVVNFTGGDWKGAEGLLRAELGRVSKYGFSPAELGELRDSYLAGLKDLVANGYRSEDWASRLASSFVKDSVLVSPEDRLRLYTEAFSEFDEKEARNYAGLLLSGSEGFVLLSLPASAGALPTKEELAAETAKLPSDPGAWKREAAASGLMARLPRPAAPLSVVERPEIGAVERVYANGLRVILKPTEFTKDEVILRAFVPRGTNLLSDTEYANAVIAAELVPASGFVSSGGGANGTGDGGGAGDASGAGDAIGPEALKSLLASKNVGGSLFLDQDSSGIKASSSAADLETLLQLVRLSMGSAALDPSYFSAAKAQLRNYGKNFLNDPGNVYNLGLSETLNPDRPRSRIFSKAGDADLLDAKLALPALSSLVSSPEGYVFAFSGSFKPEALGALCDIYLGSIPASHPGFARPRPEAFPRLGIEKEIRAGSEEKAAIILVYRTLDSATDEATVDGLDLVAEGLSRNLREALRLGAGASYDVGASAQTSLADRITTITVSFDADPARADELLGIAKAAVEKVRAEGLPEATIADIKLSMERERDKNASNNAWWASNLAYRGAMGSLYGLEGLDPVAASKKSVSLMTPSWIKAAAAAYLDPANLAAFKLLPAAK
jgi:zinc protease